MRVPRIWQGVYRVFEDGEAAVVRPVPEGSRPVARTAGGERNSMEAKTITIFGRTITDVVPETGRFRGTPSEAGPRSVG